MSKTSSCSGNMSTKRQATQGICNSPNRKKLKDSESSTTHVGQIYMGEDLECMKNPFPWQAQVRTMLADRADCHEIVWVYQRAGNDGVTKLQKEMCWTGAAKRIDIATATATVKAFTRAGKHKVYLCNLARSREFNTDFFSALEDVKDAWIKNAQLSHLWVFSKNVPNLKFCSTGRWKVYCLEDRYTDLVEMNLKEIAKEYTKTARIREL
jgi:hypothetical protein